MSIFNFWKKPKDSRPLMLLQPLEERIVLDAAVDSTQQDNQDDQDPSQIAPSEVAQDSAAGPALEPDPVADSLDQVFADDLNVVLISNALHEIEALTQASGGNAEVVIYDAELDDVGSLALMLDDLVDANGQQIAHLAILSHGEPGLLHLGHGVTVSSQSIALDTTPWLELADTLATDARIDLYGCDIGQGEQGLTLVESISEVTGATVWASDDGTGNITGSDWDLEVKSGQSSLGRLIDPEMLEDWSIYLNSSPIAYGQSLSSSGNTPLTIVLEGYDADWPDLKNVRFQIEDADISTPGIQTVDGGEVVVSGLMQTDGAGTYWQEFTYTPYADYNGVDGFQFTFEEWTGFDSGSDFTNVFAGSSVSLVDVDNDGDLDVAVSSYNSYPLYSNNLVYLNDGSGNLMLQSTFKSYSYTINLAFGDLNNDGNLDAIEANYWYQPEVVYWGDGSGHFTYGYAIGSSSDRGSSADLGDVDGDGDLDLVTGNLDDPTKLFLNDGAGTFSAPVNIDSGGTSGASVQVRLADVDDDGDLDLVAGGHGDTSKVYLNDGDGNFSFFSSFGSVDDYTRAVRLGDLNHDGHLDVVAGNNNQPTKIYMGDGTGVFTYSSSLGASANDTAGIALGDVNRDGYLDVVEARGGQPNAVYLNDGSGGFIYFGTIGSESNPSRDIELGDLNNDGILDVAISNWGGSPSEVFFGLSEISTPATVTIAVNSVNNAPTALDDAYATDEDTALTVGAPGVLGNDSDVDASDILTVTAYDAVTAQGVSVTVNPDGSFAYDPAGQFEWLAVGEQATDSFGYTVSDGNGGTDSAVVTITITGVNDAPVGDFPDSEITEVKLVASDGASGDEFGRSVSVDGDRVIVSGNGNDDAGYGSGSAYIYERQPDGSWTELKLTASDASSYSWFGNGVSILGDHALVGAVGTSDYAGSVYAFWFNGSAWTETSKLTASDAASGDQFGTSISQDGNYAIVGAWGDDDQVVDSGSAYIFERVSDGTWIEKAKLTAPDQAAGDQFGAMTVSISGDYAIVGALGDDDNGADSGSAYIYERQSDGTWVLSTKLTAYDGAAGDWFGHRVVISGDVAIVGAHGDDDNGSDSGSAYIYERQSDGTWTLSTKLTAYDGAAGDMFGVGVTISEDYLVVGNAGDDDGAANAGSVYLYEHGSSGWDLKYKLTASDPSNNAYLGGCLAISDNCLIAGASVKNSWTGAAYIYEWTEPGPPAQLEDFGTFNYDVSGYFSDVDGDTLTYELGSITYSDGLVLDGLAIDEATGVVTFTSHPDSNGSVDAEVRAYDGALYSQWEPFRFTVNPVNDAPTSTAIADVTVDEDFGDSYLYDVSGSFADVDSVLSYSITGETYGDGLALDGLSINGTTGVLTFNDALNSNGFVDVEVTATDGEYSTAQTFRFTVNAVNDAPVGDFADGEVTELKLLPPDIVTNDSLGHSVSIDGDHVIVGANGNDFPNLTNAGSAYIYERQSDGSWSMVELTASDASPYDWFGTAVSISGDYAVVGAVGASDNLGTVYVFRYDGSIWNEVAMLQRSDGWVGSNFGHSVSIDGNYVIVGAPADLDNGQPSGSAFIFERLPNGTWIEADKLTDYDGASGDYFGNSVGISDGQAIVGAPMTDDNGTNSGSVYFYERQSDGTWSLVDTKVTAYDAASEDRFGIAVGISDGQAIVGSALDDDNGTDSGSVYMYERQSEGTWSLNTKLTADDGSAGSFFGGSVTISDGYLVVGSTGEDAGVTDAGSAYVYEPGPAGWDLKFKLTASDPSYNSSFGYSAGISGNCIVVSANTKNSLAGAAYIYEWTEPGPPAQLEDFGTFNYDVSGYFSDVDGDTLTYELGSITYSDGLVLDGLAIGESSGVVTFTSHPDSHGSVDVEVRAYDGALYSEWESFRFTVNPVNDAPTSTAIVDVAVDEDFGDSYLYDVSGSFADVDSTLSYSITGATYGDGLALDGLSINGTTGVLTFNDALNSNGFVDVEVTATDGEYSTAQTFRFTVNPVNDAPTALNDAYATDEDTALIVGAPGVLGNDSDVDASDILTVAAYDAITAQGASVTVNPDGSLTYDPAGQFEHLAVGETATDSFGYTVSDGNGGTDAAMVTITVTGLNDAPYIDPSDDPVTVSVNEDETTATFTLRGYDADEPDAAGVRFLVGGVEIVGPGDYSLSNGILTALGAVTHEGAGCYTQQFTFTPSQDYNGTLTFAYLLTTPNLQAGLFEDSGQSLGASDTDSVALGDVDGDGDLDLVAANDQYYGTHPNVLWLNDGSGNFTDSGQYLGSGNTGTVAMGDVDGDGDLDIVFGRHWQSNRVWLNGENGNPVGVFSDSGQSLGSYNTFDLALGDLDGDGDLDIVECGVTNWVPRDGEVVVWLNNGNGYFSSIGEVLGGWNTWSVALADVDNDADLDVIVGNNAQGNRVLLNDGLAHFTDSGQSIGSSNTRVTSMGDLDGDGDLDIVEGNDTNTPNLLWLNDGSGNFFDSGQSLGSATTFHAVQGDVDGDGDPDVVFGNYGEPNDVWLNDGLGNFTDSGQALGSSHTFFIALGDVNGDGRIDIGTANTASEPNRIYLNVGGAEHSNTANLIIDVLPVNDAPTSTAIADVAVDEDFGDSYLYDVSGSFTDVDSAPSYSITGATYGNGLALDGLSINGTTGVLTFNDALNSNGFVDVEVTATDGEYSTAQTFRFTVNPVNDAPTSTAIVDVAVDEDFGDSYLYDVSGSFADVDSTLSYSITGSTYGDGLGLDGLSINGTTGVLTFNDALNSNGFVDVEVTATDGEYSTAQAFRFTVNPVNDAPTALSDAYATDEDTALIVGAPGVLGNDSDVDASDILTVAAYDAITAQGASVTVNPDGSLTYDPAGQFEHLAVGETATDSFGYTVSDGNGGTATATVTMTVTGLNDTPTAVGDFGTTDEDTAFTTVNVLANDTDPDASDSLSVLSIDTTGTVGLVTDNGDGTFGYAPNGQFEYLAVGELATDSFGYTVSDGNGGTSTAVVTITIAGVNDGPVATDDTAVTDEDTLLSIAAPGVLGNDTDVDLGETTTLTVASHDGTSAQGAMVVVNTDGSFSYDPTSSASLQSLAVGSSVVDTFSYTVEDVNGAQDTATVSITVTGVNDGPEITTPQTVTTDEDTEVTFTVSVDDADLGSDLIEIELVSANGTMTLSGTAGLNFVAGDGTDNNLMIFTGSLDQVNAALNGMSFQPDPDYNTDSGYQFVGDAVVTITANDGLVASEPQDVVIQVNAVDNEQSVPEDQVTYDKKVVFSSDSGNLIEISEVAPDVEVEVTLSATNGTLKLSTVGGLTFSEGDGKWDSLMTFRGTVSSVNLALEGLTFKASEKPPKDGYLEGGITIATSRLDENGNIVTLIDEDTIGITIYGKEYE